EKNIRATQPAISEFAAQLGAGSGGSFEHLRWPEVRAAFKETDIRAIEIKHGNQVQGAAMRQQREGEIGASEFEFHGFLFWLGSFAKEGRCPLLEPLAFFGPAMNFLPSWVCHSAAVR